MLKRRTAWPRADPSFLPRRVGMARFSTRNDGGAGLSGPPLRRPTMMTAPIAISTRPSAPPVQATAAALEDRAAADVQAPSQPCRQPSWRARPHCVSAARGCSKRTDACAREHRAQRGTRPRLRTPAHRLLDLEPARPPVRCRGTTRPSNGSPGSARARAGAVDRPSARCPRLPPRSPDTRQQSLLPPGIAWREALLERT